MNLSRLLGSPPRLSPMTFGREPILHRFWGGGILAALAGFSLGGLLWLQLTGFMPPAQEFDALRTLHARLQLLLFAGSFILGFALQAGPHVMGSPPPPSRAVLRLLFPLWGGFLLSLIPDPWPASLGNALISLAFLLGFRLLWTMARQAPSERRPAIAWPLAASALPLALAPWLPLQESAVALAILLTGPATTILAASQQLIANVLGGRRMIGWAGWSLFVLLVTGWASAAAAAAGLLPWSGAILPWIAAPLLLNLHSQLYTVAFSAFGDPVVPTLHIGLSAFPMAGVLLLWHGDTALDPALHLIGIGAVATLILGIVTRVSSFFSGGYALPTLLTRFLLWLWLGVALLRTAIPMGVVDTAWVPVALVLAALVLLPWSIGVARRLTRLPWPAPKP